MTNDKFELWQLGILTESNNIKKGAAGTTQGIILMLALIVKVLIEILKLMRDRM